MFDDIITLDNLDKAVKEFLINNNEMKLVKNVAKLTNSTSAPYEDVQEATKNLIELINKTGINPIDLSDVNSYIIDRDDLAESLNSKAKDDLETQGYIDSPTLQNLAFVDRKDDDYFYVNAYGRIELVNDEDVFTELRLILRAITKEVEA